MGQKIDLSLSGKAVPSQIYFCRSPSYFFASDNVSQQNSTTKKVRPHIAQIVTHQSLDWKDRPPHPPTSVHSVFTLQSFFFLIFIFFFDELIIFYNCY